MPSGSCCLGACKVSCVCVANGNSGNLGHSTVEHEGEVIQGGLPMGMGEFHFLDAFDSCSRKIRRQRNYGLSRKDTNTGVCEQMTNGLVYDRTFGFNVGAPKRRWKLVKNKAANRCPHPYATCFWTYVNNRFFRTIDDFMG
jgi:hypothetical protein